MQREGLVVPLGWRSARTRHSCDRQLFETKGNVMYEKFSILVEARRILREDAKELIHGVMSKRGMGQSELADERNEFEGHSLDYMQGYRDGQEHLAKIAREVL